MEGPDDCYLYVRDGTDVYDWTICSSLKGGQVYINSGSAGHPCPAHPRNASNLWDDYSDWRVKKARGNAGDINAWKEGGVVGGEMGRIWVGRERGDEREEKDGKEKHVAAVYSGPGHDKRDTDSVYSRGNETFL